MDAQIRVYFTYLGQDDPKKATMKKLERFGLAKEVTYGRCSRCLSLTPYAEVYVTVADSKIFRRKGICVVDGSWNRISSIKEMVSTDSRLLPLIVPANPVNYGKPGKLSSAEAVSSALFIMGYRDEAEQIMSKFNWGPNFIHMNRELLTDYAGCASQDQVKDVQDAYF